MAAERTLYAKENRRPLLRAESSVDIPFLILVLLLLTVGLTMLYSGSMGVGGRAPRVGGAQCPPLPAGSL